MYEQVALMEFLCVVLGLAVIGLMMKFEIFPFRK
jgi:hypothetical protein